MNQLAAWTTYLNLDAPGALYFTEESFNERDVVKGKGRDKTMY
jgi:hypothetical protein